MSKKLRIAVLSSAVAIAGVVGSALPAAAVTTLGQCAVNKINGSATISPPFSSTNTNPSTITSNASATGCTGVETSFSIHSVVTTNTPGDCNGLTHPSPKGTVTATGTFSITWGKGGTSNGSAKLKSTGSVGSTIAILKITSGKYFQAGHITKSKTTLSFVPGSGQDCTTTPISSVTFTNSAVEKLTKT